MSAIGAVTGNAVYSELTYKGKRFKIAQWFMDAMDAVSTTAFLKASRMAGMMGGTSKAQADREIALARTFALGGFGFDAIIEDGGLDNDHELLATFLHKLAEVHDNSFTFELAMEMVKEARTDVIAAVNRANPRNGQENGKTGNPARSDDSSPVAI